MKLNGRTGFTIIEVILVLAITGLLFVALIAGQGNNIARRRYDDSVNGFMAFLQNQFDFAMNIQNWRDHITPADPNYNAFTAQCIGDVGDSQIGRSDCAIYGIMLEFGTGECDYNNPKSGCFVRYTWVVGRDYRTLRNANPDSWAGVMDSELDVMTSDIGLRRAMPWRQQSVEWGSRLRTPATRTGDDPFTGWNENVTGAIMIIRMPISNTVQVFASNSLPARVDSIFHTDFDSNDTRVINQTLGGLLTENNRTNPKFICLDSPDSWQIGGVSAMRTIAVNPNANNASAVQLFMQDTQNQINGVNYDARCSN